MSKEKINFFPSVMACPKNPGRFAATIILEPFNSYEEAKITLDSMKFVIIKSMREHGINVMQMHEGGKK